MASLPSPQVSSARIGAVRRFNRFYTRHLGLLDEGFLSSSLSLTQMRVLYELANREQSTAAEVCDALGLDPGYLSRILSGFEKERLVDKKGVAEGHAPNSAGPDQEGPESVRAAERPVR